MTTLAEDYPRQQERCRRILESALEIGPPGVFLATMLRASLSRAEQAAATGDTVAMLAAYADLKGYRE